MTFERIHRGFPEKQKPEIVPDNGIVLFWHVLKTTPRITIVLGRSVAEAMRMFHSNNRVQLLIGRDEDKGSAALRFTPWDSEERGDFEAYWRGRVCRVDLTSDVSRKYFPDCKRTTISAASILIDGPTVIFPIPGSAA